MHGTCSLSQFVADDPRLLSSGETSFLFMRGETGTLDVLTSFDEVFGRNQIRIKVVRVAATDLLGVACGHCGAAIEEPGDMVVTVRKGAVKGCLHETCFRKWFVGADKAALQPYRFLTIQKTRISTGDPMTHLVMGSSVIDCAADAALVTPLDFGDIRQSAARAQAAVERQVLTDTSRPGINIFLCPRCTAPQEIPFLETEERIHTCKQCRGRFKVIVKEVS